MSLTDKSTGQWLVGRDGSLVKGRVLWGSELMVHVGRARLEVDEGELGRLSEALASMAGNLTVSWTAIANEAAVRELVVGCWRRLAQDLVCILADDLDVERRVGLPDDRHDAVEVVIRPASFGLTQTADGLLDGLGVTWVVVASLHLMASDESNRRYCWLAWKKLGQGLEIAWERIKADAETAIGGNAKGRERADAKGTNEESN